MTSPIRTINFLFNLFTCKLCFVDEKDFYFIFVRYAESPFLYHQNIRLDLMLSRK